MRNNKNQMYIIKIFIALAMITSIIFLLYSSLTPSKLKIGAKTSNMDDSPKIKFTLIDQEGNLIVPICKVI